MPTPNLYPRYSFVQAAAAYGAPGCYPDPAACLPLSSSNHLRFQVTVYHVPYGLAATTSAGVPTDPYAAIVPMDWPCENATIANTGAANPLLVPLAPFLWATPVWLVEPTPGSDGISTATYGTVRLCFDSQAYDYSGLSVANNTFVPAIGECFKLALVWDELTNQEDTGYSAYPIVARTLFGCTNCFVRTPVGDCYSSVLTYCNPPLSLPGGTHAYNDAFDFNYTDDPGYKNVVELPIYLRDPVMSNEQKVYTRSDGSMAKLYERKEEVYELETELMPYTWHKALDVALSHDYVQITNANLSSFDPLNTASTFVKKENYEIEYMKAPLSSLGKGHCKLSNADPVHLVNNNCA